MIRLAVSDLDGTLLTPERRLPENTFEIIRKLKEKGIVFGAASGRQLQNLIDFFAPVADDIVIIAENGGLGWMRGELLFCNADASRKSRKDAASGARQRGIVSPVVRARTAPITRI